MQIPSQLYQFPMKSLLVVFDEQQCRLLFAHNGTLTELSGVHADRQERRGRPSLQSQRGHGRTFHIGASSERTGESISRTYLRAIRERLREEMKKRTIDATYILAPSKVWAVARDHVVELLGESIQRIIAHDFVHISPVEIVARLTETLRVLPKV